MLADYLKNILLPLVEFPEEIVINESRDDLGVFLSVSLSPPDTGRIIGRDGRSIDALRRIMTMYGKKNAMRISLSIKDPISY